MKRFWLKCLIVTIVTIVLTWVTSRIADMRIFQLLFPETIAIQEFEFTDFAFDLTLPDNINDKITIVNIGLHERGVLGDLIRAVNHHKPSVIGIDAFFNCGGTYDTINCPQLRDQAGNENLRKAMREVKALVLNALPHEAGQSPHAPLINGYDSLELSDSIFSNHVKNGHALISLMITSELAVPACRTFQPRITMVNGKVVDAFSVEIARLHDSIKVEKFLRKFDEHDNVPINFKGNIVKYGFEGQQELFLEPRHFYALDADDILADNFPPNLITGRIILFEYLGESLTHPASEKEKFYTPLNRKKIGRTFPDMYPSVVHANIINMIITEDYLYELSNFQELLLTFFICLFHVAALMAIRRNLARVHDLFAVLLVIAIIGFMALFRLLLFTEFNIKSDLTFTIGSLALAAIVVGLYNDLLDSKLEKYLKSRNKNESQEEMSQVTH